MLLHRLRSRTHFLGSLSAAAACGSVALAADTYTLRMSIAPPAGSLEATVAVRFATSVARRSNNQLSIEVYPGGQLASEAQIPSALATGVIDMVIQATSFVTPLLPQFQVFDTPFLFKNFDAAYRVFDGRIGEEFFSLLESKGMVALGWGVPGFRELETTKPVSSLEDVKGVRVRTPAASLYAATWQALGAIPVAIDLSELFTALTQHTVDGLEIALTAFVQAKYYTVAKYVAMTSHMISVEPIVCNKTKLDALPANLQRVMREEGKAAANYMRQLATDRTADAVKFLKANGGTIHEIPFAAFRKAVEPVYAMVQAKLGGDLLDRVSRAANSA